MTAYYNDHDPGACAWLRELIRAGLIPKGEVDGRSILDVEPADLSGFTSCHFFAGIGGWAYALRLAGWRDEWPVWTGSPPCQPFSAAGKGLSRDDPRHLAPHYVRLVGACRPGLLFGEQVASADVFGRAASGSGKRAAAEPEWVWLDDLSDRLEAARYAVGASDIPAAGIGAPHIRQRTFFGAIRLADTNDARPQGRAGMPERAGECAAWQNGMAGGVADATHEQNNWTWHGRPEWRDEHSDCGDIGGMDHAASARHFGAVGRAEGDPRVEAWVRVLGQGRGSCGLADAQGRGRRKLWDAAQSRRSGHTDGSGQIDRTDPLDGFWRGADWLWCRDAKWRPVEPGLEPLAHGLPARVGRLRGYGNAIVPQVAAQFVTAFCEASGLPLDTQEQHQ